MGPKPDMLRAVQSSKSHQGFSASGLKSNLQYGLGKLSHFFFLHMHFFLFRIKLYLRWLWCPRPLQPVIVPFDLMFPSLTCSKVWGFSRCLWAGGWLTAGCMRSCEPCFFSSSSQRLSSAWSLSCILLCFILLRLHSHFLKLELFSAFSRWGPHGSEVKRFAPRYTVSDRITSQTHIGHQT